MSARCLKSPQDNRQSKFKARRMPDFGFIPDFIPLLNEKPITMPIEFDSEVEKRMSKRKN